MLIHSPQNTDSSRLFNSKKDRPLLQENSDAQYKNEMSGSLGENLPVGDTPSNSTVTDNPSDALNLQSIGISVLKKYGIRRADDNRRSVIQLITTLVPFFAFLAIMIASLQYAYWITLLLAVPTAGLLVRLFIFQHDCGHGSFFSSRLANDSLGRFISIFTLTPYDHWKRSHAMHHATSGNLDNRGQGDVPTITVDEYLAMSPLKQLGYRIFRNPIFMIMIGVPINFIFLQRTPLGSDIRNVGALRSIFGLNLMMLLVFGGAMMAFGVVPVLVVYLPVIILASSIGGWLFYVQHQYEDTYWARKEDWDFHKSAVTGSSYYELPRILQWFTGNIGLHHIHHLCSRIPNHRLHDCCEEFPELEKISKKITLRGSLDCWRYSLVDEKNGVMIGFRELREQRLANAPS